MIAAPVKAMACAYCGEFCQDQWRSCCGEVHYEELLICPECGDDIDTRRSEVAGIETYQHCCTNCDYRSDPE